MDIPALDLARAEQRIAEQVDARWRRLRQNTAFIGGDEVAELETAFSRFQADGHPHPDSVGTVAVANGTDALVLALRCLDLRPGDEVIVPALTFIATAGAVVWAGGRPVFADVEEETLNLDPESVAGLVGERTVGVIGVHLYGRPFAVDRLRTLCDRHGLWLVEDAAQAQGARWRGQRVGTLGQLGTFSFYPTKNLGAFGDAGAVTGSEAGLLDRVRRVANHGRAQHTLHSEVGTNSRMDALQAAVLNCRLPLLDGDNERRRTLAARYRQGLDGVGDLRFPVDPPEAEPVYHQFTVRTARRDELREHLASRGVGSTLYYPHALHRQPALEALAVEVTAPVAEAAAAEVISLPMFPELTEGEAQRVVETVRAFYGS